MPSFVFFLAEFCGRGASALVLGEVEAIRTKVLSLQLAPALLGLLLGSVTTYQVSTEMFQLRSSDH